MINIVTDCGAVPDGITDNTLAIQAAFDQGALYKEPVEIPSGVFRASNLVVREKQRIIGWGEMVSFLKPIPGTTGIFISSSGNTDDIHYESWGIDGGFGEGCGTVTTSCDSLVINGSRPTVRDFTILNSAGRSMRTQYTANARLGSILGRFERITLDKSQKDGWRNEGPNDSYINQVEIVDAGLGQDNAYTGYLSTGGGTVRADNLHVWNRKNPNQPYAGAFIDNGLNYFNNCQFECGTTSLIVKGNYNTFTNSQFYAPDGEVALRVWGSWNEIAGIVGAGYDMFNPNFKGCVLGDANPLVGESKGNIIRIRDGGCNLGAIDVTYSGGNNRIYVRGFKDPSKPFVVGTPKPTDIVDAKMN